MGCLNCGKDLNQLPKKREKIFCDSTCRSNYWQKSDRLEKQGLSIDEIIKRLNADAKKNKVKPEPKKELPPKTDKTEIEKQVAEIRQQIKPSMISQQNWNAYIEKQVSELRVNSI